MNSSCTSSQACKWGDPSFEHSVYTTRSPKQGYKWPVKRTKVFRYYNWLRHQPVCLVENAAAFSLVDRQIFSTLFWYLLLLFSKQWHVNEPRFCKKNSKWWKFHYLKFSLGNAKVTRARGFDEIATIKYVHILPRPDRLWEIMRTK